VQTAGDGASAVDHGADGVVVSNHGGRQLDRAPVPLREVPAIRAAVGPETEILLDSGIMCGGDVVAALAAGANFTMVGRAYLYGLMAGGQPGVERAIDLLRDEVRLIMQLLGATSVTDLTPVHVRLDAGSRAR
jgi:L-lactate dehydrogenase (cytochrome)